MIKTSLATTNARTAIIYKKTTHNTIYMMTRVVVHEPNIMRDGVKPLPEPMMISLPTHIRVTWHQ